jgi:hypothetical protein
MRRLQQLLQTRIIAENDVLYFTFKKNKFTGHVAQGGLIWHCTWQRPGEEARPIFDKAAQLGGQPFVRTFESLTDWTETCIQECLDEYHTRYSSWKRVRHQRTEQTMETLFKHLQRQNLTHPQQRGAAKDNSKTLLLFEQIASQKQHIDALEKGVERWTAWFRQHHPNKMLPVQPIAHHVPQTQSSDAIAQPFVLNSARGQFMVLQRVNEVAPAECVSWLKSMGQSRFKQYMTDCEKQIEFTPMETTIPTSTTSAAAARQFVHEFFSA